jgi:hypothetical protein
MALTPITMHHSYPRAIRLALAAYRNDGETFARLWQESGSQDALLWVLGRLPGAIVAALSIDDGNLRDPEKVLTDMLDALVALPDSPTDERIH